MKKIIAAILMSMVIIGNLQAQKYFTRTGEVSFYSSTPIEDIEAVCNSASTVYDAESGKVQWAVLIKSFEFEKALMQEHFNENYMESSKFPKALFKGSIKDFKDINLTKNGIYEVNVNGVLEIHGVSQEVETKATFTVENGMLSATSKLIVKVIDYGIEIPSVVKNNIAKEIDILIKANYEILDKS